MGGEKRNERGESDTHTDAERGRSGEEAARIQAEARLKAAAEMEARCERVQKEMLDGTFPMKPDNPLLNATDDELRAYIRRKREEFEPRLKEIQEAKRKEIERSKTIYRGEKGIPE